MAAAIAKPCIYNDFCLVLTRSKIFCSITHSNDGNSSIQEDIEGDPLSIGSFSRSDVSKVIKG